MRKHLELGLPFLFALYLGMQPLLAVADDKSSKTSLATQAIEENEGHKLQKAACDASGSTLGLRNDSHARVHYSVPLCGNIFQNIGQLIGRWLSQSIDGVLARICLEENYPCAVSSNRYSYMTVEKDDPMVREITIEDAVCHRRAYHGCDCMEREFLAQELLRCYKLPGLSAEAVISKIGKPDYLEKDRFIGNKDLDEMWRYGNRNILLWFKKGLCVRAFASTNTYH